MKYTVWLVWIIEEPDNRGSDNQGYTVCSLSLNENFDILYGERQYEVEGVLQKNENLHSIHK